MTTITVDSNAVTLFATALVMGLVGLNVLHLLSAMWTSLSADRLTEIRDKIGRIDKGQDDTNARLDDAITKLDAVNGTLDAIASSSDDCARRLKRLPERTTL